MTCRPAATQRRRGLVDGAGHAPSARSAFTGAPRSFGTDATGRDIFEFLPGDVGHDPWTPQVAGDAALTSAGRLLRAYHDATTDVAASWRDGWQKPAREPAEVICHNDVAPYNCVYDGDRAVGLIDFDVAAPSPRSWDLAYAVYRFVPLGSAAGPRTDERLTLFFDAYGADEPLRRAALAAVAPRLRAISPTTCGPPRPRATWPSSATSPAATSISTCGTSPCSASRS